MEKAPTRIILFSPFRETSNDALKTKKIIGDQSEFNPRGFLSRYPRHRETVEPWKIIGIKTDETKKEVHVELRYPEKTPGVCPTCGAASKIHDRLPERVWRHLDSCEYLSAACLPAGRAGRSDLSPLSLAA